MTYDDYLFWMRIFCVTGLYIGMWHCEREERREG